MPMNQLERIGLIATLARRQPKLGRTAVMKLCYFIQTLGKLDLGYSFSLYSYGPFDSDVLADLSSAENMGVIKSNVISYHGGYRYEILASHEANAAEQAASQFLIANDEAIELIVNRFGGITASELELLSTIIYISRNSKAKNSFQLANEVHNVKPHFRLDVIQERAADLAKSGYLMIWFS